MITFLYIVTALVWGWFAMVAQVQLDPDTSDDKLIFTFIINAVGLPIAVAIAAKKHWDQTFIVTKST